MNREKESVLPLFRKEEIGVAYTLRNESEEQSFRNIDPYIVRVGIKQREVESSKKAKSCLTKMMTPPLPCVASRERMPDQEWVQSERRTENPGIQKKEHELRMDSWIQIRSTGWDKRK